jgi:putative hydrolase of the HAD superfamily
MRNEKKERAVIRNVILDYGLVLCHPADPQVVEQMSQMFRVDVPAFWSLYGRNRESLDRGDLTPEAYWTMFARDAGQLLDAEQLLWLRKYDIEMWSHLNDDLVDWVNLLRAAGDKTCLLSNLNSEFTAHVRASCGWVKRFDFPVFSSEVRITKPDPEAYRHCLRLLKGRPEETLFIDDRNENVVAARKEGIAALVYRSTAELRADLEAMGWKLLPSDTTEITVPRAASLER